MNTNARWCALVALAASLAVSMSSTGCSLIVEDELGSLRPDLQAKRDVEVGLRDFGPHMGQQITIDIVSPAGEDNPSDRIFARARIDPFPGDCVDVRLSRGAPFAASRVDFWADANNSGTLDDPDITGGDHTWQEELDDGGRLLFLHDFDFQAVTESGLFLQTFQLEVTEVPSDLNDTLATVLLATNELVDVQEGIRRRTVPALYARGIADGTLALTLAGVSDPGTRYDVEILLDDGAMRCVLPSQAAPGNGEEPFRVASRFADLECEARTPPDCDGLDEQCDDGDGDPDACEELVRECPFEDCTRPL